jgi:hypothetical protein
MSKEAYVFKQGEDFEDAYDLASLLSRRFGEDWEKKRTLTVIAEEK